MTFRLYFKHLYPSYVEWKDEPFSPWMFEEAVLFSVLSFFEFDFLEEDFSLKEILNCEIFMDSGAFAATSMGFYLDPYEVAEMHLVLGSDLIIPLDHIIFENDSKEIIQNKMSKTIENTEILLDNKPKGAEIIGPLQGFSEEDLQYSFEKFFDLGIRKFAIGGIVFQSNLESICERITLTRRITQKYSLHIFGKFLHPELLKIAIASGADSVDGFGYILSSLKGLYITNQRYEPLSNISDEEIQMCNCPICRENSIEDFLNKSRESQHLLIQHNIHSLIRLKNEYIKQKIVLEDISNFIKNYKEETV